MTDVPVNMSAMRGHGHSPGDVSRSIVIGLTNIGMLAHSCGCIGTRRKANTSIPKSRVEEGFLLGRPRDR